jgi:hypothetical protein
VDAELTLRQREVFVAIVINDVPLDALVTEFGFNRMNDWQGLDASGKPARGMSGTPKPWRCCTYTPTW